jgi:hypothetical protein
MWLAALTGRLSYLAHLTSGHVVTWRTSPPDLPLCAGDIVCHDCGQVLWCRAHDPWQADAGDDRHRPGDFADGTPAVGTPAPLFDGLQHVLRLATQCPSGRAGDDIRRAACELIEAHSEAGRHTGRRRILTAIASAEWRRSRGRSREDDPLPATLSGLAKALDGVRSEPRAGRRALP